MMSRNLISILIHDALLEGKDQMAREEKITSIFYNVMIKPNLLTYFQKV